MGLGAWAQDTKNLLPNPGFEDGVGKEAHPPGWAVHPYDQLGKQVVWAEPGHSGARSILIQDPTQYNTISTVVSGIEPGKLYKFVGYAKAEVPVEATGLIMAAFKIIQEDADGKAIVHPDAPPASRHAQIQIHVKPGADWQKFEGQFVADPAARKAQVLLQAHPPFKGKVWFDDVSLARTDEDSRASGEWVNTLHTDIVTPHIPWARPLAGGPVKVLALVNNQGKRELVELAQRLEMQLDAVITPGPALIGFPSAAAKWSGTSEAEKLREFSDKLARNPQVLLVGNVTWQLLPVELRYDLFRRASEGMGLVFVVEQSPVTEELQMLREHPEPEGKRALLSALPAEQMRVGCSAVEDPRPSAPLTKPLAEVVTTCRIKKGRAVFLDYPCPESFRMKGQMTSLYSGIALSPWVSYDPETLHEYEYYQQLLIRAILWTAKRAGGAALDVPQRWYKSGDLEVHVALSKPVAKGEMHYRLLTRKGIIQAEGRAPASGDKVALKFPVVLAAEYLLELRLIGPDRSAQAFGTFALLVESPVKMAAIEVARARANEGVLAGTIRCSGAESLRLTLTDSLGRLVIDQTMRAAGEATPFQIPLPDRLVARLHTLRVQAQDAQRRPLAAESVTVAVPIPDTQDVSYLVWSSANGGDMPHFLMNRYCKQALGMDLYESNAYQKINVSQIRTADVAEALHGGTLLSLTFDQTTTPYTIPVLYRGKSLERTPCLNDPSYRTFFERIIRGGVGYYYRNGVRPPVYTLGDEFLLAYPGGPDVCFNAHTQKHFRAWLQKRYADLAALNAAWGSAFTTWDEVSPITLEEARKLNQPGRWLDHRLHMDAVIIDLLSDAKTITRQIDPQAVIGFEGMFRSYSECGYDLEGISDLCGFLVTYEYPYRWEMFGSFSQPAPGARNYYGMFSNSVGGVAGGTTYQVWKALFHGLNSIWWWRISGDMGFLGFDMGVGSNAAKHRGVLDQARQVAEARHGPARLLHDAQRSAQPVAILHSQTSLHMTKYDTDAAAQSSAWAAWQFILEDLGFGYRYVKSADLAAGRVTPANTAALVLPYTVCLPDDVVAAVKQYAAAGGTVLADIRPAMMDAHGRNARPGALDDLFGIRRTAYDTPAAADSALGRLTLDSGVRAAGAKAAGQAKEIPYGLSRAEGQGRAILLNFSASDYGAAMTANDFSMAQYKAEFAVNARIRELVAQLLAPSGLRPIVGVGKPDGNQPGIEQFEWRRAATRLVCLTRKFYGEEYLRGPADLPVFLGEMAHVYDVRARKYLGRADHVTAHLEPGDSCLFALLPYEVKMSPLMAQLSDGPAVTVHGALDVGGQREIHHVIRLEFTGPDGQARECYAQNVTVAKPSFELRLPLALNEAAGAWQVTTTDVASGASSRATFVVK